MFLSVLTVSLIFLLSCKTAPSAAKVKEDTHTSTENANSKAGLYRAMAERVTKQCPVEVDEAITLTKLEYKEEQHALVYTYLFSGGVYEDMNEQIWAMIRKATESMLKEKLKTNQMLYQIRKDGTTLIYIYTDKNGKELFSVTLQPGDY
jgi:hypothetical protein